MEDMETKQIRVVNLEIKSFDENGSFSGYGSVFGNTDAYNDVVTKGAFAKHLAAIEPNAIKLLWQHDPSKPIGVYKKIMEDDHGLWVEGKLLVNELQQAAEAYALLKAGAISGLSIGFSINPNGANMGADGKRYLTDLKLWEISLVTFPANTAANIANVKAKPQTSKDFENFLRDVGNFSKREARLITAKGFQEGIRCDAEPSEEVTTEIEDKTNLSIQIREILQTLRDGANKL